MSKKSLIWLVIIFVLVLVGAWMMWLRAGSEGLYGNASSTPSVSPSTQVETNGSIKKQGVGPTNIRIRSDANAADVKQYTQLVTEYNGRRIQFDMLCQTVPSTVTYKTGTDVMFDNRSGDQRYISIDGKVYNFPGYGYKILNLKSSTLPYSLYLNCGSAINVGQILLQK